MRYEREKGVVREERQREGIGRGGRYYRGGDTGEKEG